MNLQPEDQLPKSTGALNTQFKDISIIWANEQTGCTILKATHRLDGCTYAIKKIKIPEELETDTQKNLDDHFQELQILTKFNHPNIVKYHNSWIEEEILKEKENSENLEFQFQFEEKNIQFLYIKMEYCTGTSLATYVQKNELTPQRAKEIFIQILQGMKEVHSQNIIHRDLKPDNIFVDEGGKKVKIGDFGLSSLHGLEEDGRSDGSKLQSEQQIQSKVYNRSDDLRPSAQSRISKESESQSLRFSEQSETQNLQFSEQSEPNKRIVGTPLYCSPQQQAGKEYGKETDIFALGLIFYQILHFPKATDQEKYKLFAALREELNLESEFEARFPVEASIVKSMAYFYPSKRAKIEEVLLKLTGIQNNPVENIPSVPVVVNIMKEKEEKKEVESEGIFSGKGQAHIYVKVEGITNTIKIENGITSNVLAGGNRNKGRKLRFKYQTKDHKGEPIDPIFVRYLD